MLLWERLRNRNFMDLKFKRQKPIGRFILDFYCAALKLGVEIDGPVHEKQKEYDAGRDAFLNGIGISMIRFENNEVMLNIEGVLERIKTYTESFRANQGHSTLTLSGEGQG
jgi:very-short-patch-repair endonuclease